MSAAFAYTLGVVLIVTVAGCVIAAGRWRHQARESSRRASAAESSRAQIARRLGAYADALSRIRDGVLLVGTEGDIGYANESVQRILDSEDRTLASRLVSAGKRAATGAEFPRQLVESAPLGRTFEVSATVGPSAGDGVVLVVDVTEQVRLDAVRTDFVANASHELKTPLGALSLLAETISGADDDATRERLSTQIQSEAKRLAHVVDDILELAEAEAGSPDRHEIRVIDVIEDAVRLAADQSSRTEPEVTIGDVADVRVVANRVQLVSALQNLVTNAVVHAFPGERTGRVTVSARDGDGFVEFRVGDDGVGISQRHVDRLFERFFRVDRARSRTSGGTGLGLSIVRHVAMAHGGDVGVESEVGVGSTFWMRIPKEVSA